MNVYPLILAGGEFRSPLEEIVGKPVSLLPVANASTLVELWGDRIQWAFTPEMRIAMLFGSSSDFQAMESLGDDPRFMRHIDPRPNRGTGGVIADHWKTLPADTRRSEYILAIDRSACPPISLDSFASALEQGADVVIGTSDFDRLAGIIAIKSSVLEFVPEVGYFDLKEQALRAVLDAGLKVIAVPVIPRAIHLKTIGNWISMVRFLAKHARDGDPRMNIRGSCIDPDADIRRASIIDSVVMKNAVVHDDVVVARSVVCEGTVIPRGTRVIDSIVGGASHQHLPGSSRGTR
jgi:hypothetical protein